MKLALYAPATLGRRRLLDTKVGIMAERGMAVAYHPRIPYFRIPASKTLALKVLGAAKPCPNTGRVAVHSTGAFPWRWIPDVNPDKPAIAMCDTCGYREPLSFAGDVMPAKHPELTNTFPTGVRKWVAQDVRMTAELLTAEDPPKNEGLLVILVRTSERTITDRFIGSFPSVDALWRSGNGTSAVLSYYTAPKVL